MYPLRLYRTFHEGSAPRDRRVLAPLNEKRTEALQRKRLSLRQRRRRLHPRINESFLNIELHIKELDVWSSEAKSLLPVTAMDGIRKFNNSLIYQKAQLHLQKKEYGNVWSCIKKLKSVELMKLILLIILPKRNVQ